MINHQRLLICLLLTFGNRAVGQTGGDTLARGVTTGSLPTGAALHEVTENVSTINGLSLEPVITGWEGLYLLPPLQVLELVDAPKSIEDCYGYQAKIWQFAGGKCMYSRTTYTTCSMQEHCLNLLNTVCHQDLCQCRQGYVTANYLTDVCVEFTAHERWSKEHKRWPAAMAQRVAWGKDGEYPAYVKNRAIVVVSFISFVIAACLACLSKWVNSKRKAAAEPITIQVVENADYTELAALIRSQSFNPPTNIQVSNYQYIVNSDGTSRNVSPYPAISANHVMSNNILKAAGLSQSPSLQPSYIMAQVATYDETGHVTELSPPVVLITGASNHQQAEAIATVEDNYHENTSEVAKKSASDSQCDIIDRPAAVTGTRHPQSSNSVRSMSAMTAQVITRTVSTNVTARASHSDSHMSLYQDTQTCNCYLKNDLLYCESCKKHKLA